MLSPFPAPSGKAFEAIILSNQRMDKITPSQQLKSAFLDKSRPAPTLIAGVNEHSPLPGSCGGCAPQKLKARGELPALTNLPPSETQNLGKPSANEGGQKLGAEGAQPHPRGPGGCAPKAKARGKLLTLTNPPPSGTQNAGKPSANEGGENNDSLAILGPPFRPCSFVLPTPTCYN